MTSSSLIELLMSNVSEPYGLVNVQAVIDELTAHKIDPAVALTDLFRDPEASAWHFYALVGMRSLALHRRLKQKHADTLLRMTEALAPYADTDEYFKTISVLACSRETAPVLVKFVRQTLEKKNIQDWRWLAFFAVGSILEKKTASIPRELVKKLLDEAPNEPEPQRREQLEEIADVAQKVFGLP